MTTVIIDKTAKEQQDHLKLSVTKLIDDPNHIVTSVDYGASDVTNPSQQTITFTYIVADEVKTE